MGRFLLIVAVASCFAVTRCFEADEHAFRAQGLLQTQIVSSKSPLDIGDEPDDMDGENSYKTNNLHAKAEQSNALLKPILERVSMLEKTARDDPTNVTNTGVESVQSLLDVLENNFMKLLRSQSSDDQTAYNTQKNELNGCISHKDKRLHAVYGDVPLALTAASTKKVKHEGCRKAQKSFQEFRTAANLVGGSTWTSLAGVADETQVDHSDLCSKRTTFTTDLDAYRLLDPVDDVASSCNSDQSDYENHYCSWLSAKASTCIGFDECVTATGLSTFKTDIEARVASRRAMYQTIEKVKCRLERVKLTYDANATVSPQAASDQCDSTPAPPASVFALTLEIPQYSTCSSNISNAASPSTSDASVCTTWRSQEYNYDLNTHVATSNCQAICTLPTTVGASPNVATGCTDGDDVNDVCPFYARHFDACGRYGDGAVSMCCACGGGTTTTTTQAPTPALPNPVPTQLPTAAAVVTKFEHKGNWEQDKAFCEAKGQRLPTRDELCPGGKDSEPVAGYCDGNGDDKWTAVSDTTNEMVGCSSDLLQHGSRLCWTHTEGFGAPPSWATDANGSWHGWTYCMGGLPAPTQVVGAFVFAAEGQNCNQRCVEEGRTCSSDIKSHFNLDVMKQAVKQKFGRDCIESDANWWVNDQPNYVSNAGDGNYDKCIGVKNIPDSVDCNYVGGSVSRYCLCKAPTPAPTQAPTPAPTLD